MAQSNHHRPDSPADKLQRPARRHYGGASHPRRDLTAFVGHSFGATRLPVTAKDERRSAGVRVCVGRARP